MMVYGDHQDANDKSHPGEEAVVWIDGVAIEAMHIKDNTWFTAPEHWSPVYDRSLWSFGAGVPSSTPYSYEIWYDAIALGPERIGRL